MRLIKPPKSLGYIPGPRPRLPDEQDGRLRAVVWVLLIVAAIAVAVLFAKKPGG